MLRQQRICNELCKVMILRNKYKLQFVNLIGGRVCNPRQQQVAYSRLATIGRCSSLLLPRVKNPPPN